MPFVADKILELVQQPPLAVRRSSITESEKLLKEAEKLIPSCSQTFSKAPAQFVRGVAPVFIRRASGCRFWDVDGNEYLDFSMGLGAILVGYANSEVNEAITQQLARGVSFSLPHEREVSLARLLSELIPCAQMVRFGKNGSDVTSAAVRVARAFTAREHIACSGYHGWQDWFVGTTTRKRGVPAGVSEQTHVFKYNDPASLEAVFTAYPNQIAGVIMEPMGLVEPKADFLEVVKAIAHKHGALLIFDEIVTGFRFGLGGAQKLFGVIPDLACFGKGIANGMPLSAIVGQRDVMQLFDEVFFSSTFGGEAASLAAAEATITILRREGVLEKLWHLGATLRDGYNALTNHYGLAGITACEGLSPRTGISFSGAEALAIKTFVQQECIKRGMCFTAAHNLSVAHTEEDIQEALGIYRTVLELLAEALKRNTLHQSLEGPVIQPVFRKM